MKASEIMSREVVSVRPDTRTSSIALLLFKNGISAVPVLDEDGKPVGMVSEGDLLPRNESERAARRDWWLKLLAEGEELNPDYVSDFDSQDRPARQIMTSPVITVAEDTDLAGVAEILSSHRIKRAPVVRNGRVIGIVSRADLVRALAEAKPQPTGNDGRTHGALADVITEIERRAGDPSFVQVIMSPRASDPIGHRRYWPIYAAAERCNRPIGLHVQGFSGGHASTGSGWPTYYLQEHYGTTGNMRVTVEVIVPQDLNSKARSAIEELREATAGADPREELLERAKEA